MKSWRVSGARVGRAGLGVGALVLALAAQACGPASASTHVTSRYFGMHAPSISATGGFPDAPVGAVNLTTNGVYWPDIEPSDGNFQWTRLDGLVDQAHAHGAQPLLVLGLTPRFASTTPRHEVVAATVPKMTAWKDYVRHVVNKYGTRIDYQVWPEADIAANWSGRPKQLAKLVVAAARIIHKNAPKAVVVSPAMVLRLPYQQRAMSKFFAVRVDGVRVGRFLDAVGIDAYPLQHGTPEDSVALIKKARKILVANKVTAPLWNVEITYGVAGAHATVSPYTASKQASYVARTFLLNAANGVKRVYWLGWARIAEVAIQMVQPDGVTPSAAGNAYTMVRGWMAGQTVKTCARKPGTHVYACAMVRSGRASWVYWTTRGTGARQAARSGQSVLPASPEGKNIQVCRATCRSSSSR